MSRVGFFRFFSFSLADAFFEFYFTGSLLGFTFVQAFPQNLIYLFFPMDGLSENFARCFSTRLPEEEEIVVEDDSAPVNNTVVTQALVGRLVSPKIVSGLAIKMHLTRLIQPVCGLTLQELGPNQFVLGFAHPMDCALAMEGSPWLVEKCAVLLQPLEEGSDPKLLKVNLMHIYRCPFAFYIPLPTLKQGRGPTRCFSW